MKPIRKKFLEVVWRSLVFIALGSAFAGISIICNSVALFIMAVPFITIWLVAFTEGLPRRARIIVVIILGELAVLSLAMHYRAGG